MELILRYKGAEYVCTYDDSDNELISRYKWHYHNGYAKSGNILMHRLILGLTDPKIQVDHKDHNGLNNCRANIRTCNKSENQHNKISKIGSSIYKGVYRQKGKWHSQIVFNNEKIYLGFFRSEKTAGRAYDRTARELFKDFAFTNLPEMEEPQQLTIKLI